MDLWRGITLEGPVWHTFAGLATRPGQTVRDYLDCRRRHYVNPLTLVLVAGAAAVAMEQQFLPVPELPADASPRLRRAIAAQLLILQYSHLVTLLCLPVFALTLRALRWRGPRTSAEHFVFGLFVFAASFLLQAALSPLYVFAPAAAPYVVQLAPFAYLAWAAWGYLPERPLMAVGCALLADLVLYVTGAVLGIGFVWVRLRT
jgi:hypothetical protein